VESVRSNDYEPAAVERFLAEMAATDGHAPLSEHKRGGMADGTARVVVSSDADGIWLAGVAARHETDGHWAVEAAVAGRARLPEREREAIGRAVAIVPDRARHTLWAFRNRQIEAARALGYRPVRAVVRLSAALADVALSAGGAVDIRPMADTDVPAIVSINNRAFAGHPEQGAMTEEGFHDLERFEWFDASGVVVARTDRDVVGFCKTKREADAVGEIYLVAVDSANVGRGIGRELTTAALRLLSERGARVAQVWTDESNLAAISLYRSIGLDVDFRTQELALPRREASTD
jgi:mycothiol synthase